MWAVKAVLLLVSKLQIEHLNGAVEVSDSSVQVDTEEGVVALPSAASTFI